MPTRDLSIRLSLKDGDVVRRGLQSLGKDGQQALARIEQQSQPASRGLLAVNAASRHARGGLDSMAGSLGTVGVGLVALGPAGIAAAAAIYLVVRAVQAISTGVINTRIEFERLETALQTVVGNDALAADRFRDLLDFAKETPFQVQEVVDAFIKLEARGLQPNLESLESFGNLASAMGKSLDQAIEAVADAAVGEFERLKEFGIRASSEGDRVAFTFRGVTTEVGKNADEITKFLLSIGNTDFAGAMERQAATMGGAFSNLSDSVDQFQNAVGSLLSPVIIEATKNLSDMFSVLTDLINSFEELENLSTGNLNSRIDDINEKIITRTNQITQLKGLQDGQDGPGKAEIQKRIDEIEKQIRTMEVDLLAAELELDARETAGLGVTDSGGASEPGLTDAEQKAKDKIDQVIADLRFKQAQGGRTEFGQALFDNLKRAGLDGANGSSAAVQEITDLTLALQKLKEEQDAASDAEKARNDLKREGDTLTERLRTAEEARAVAVEDINRLLAEGVITQETHTRAIEEANKRLEDAQMSQLRASTDAADGIKRAMMDIRDASRDAATQWEQDTRGMADTFRENWIDIVAEGKSGADALRSIFNDLQRRIAGRAFDRFIGGAFDKVLGSFFHEGGVVGPGAGSTPAPAAAFIGAPRFHGGGGFFGPRERPAVLEVGEEVLTADDPRHIRNLRGGAGVTINQTNTFTLPQGSGGGGGVSREMIDFMTRELKNVTKQVVAEELGRKTRPGGQLNQMSFV